MLPFFCSLARADGGSWRELEAQAELLFKEGKNEEAVKAAQGALADAEKNLGPEDSATIDIVARLSQFYRAMGDDSRLKRLATINSKNFDVWLALGVLLHYQEKSLEAEDALKKSLALKADDLKAEVELARVDQDLGRDEDAVKLFEKAIKQNPRDYDLYMHLARSDMSLGRFAEAKEAFAQAKKIKSKTAEAYITEGYFHLDVGESAQAEEAFKSAIAVDTSSPFGYHHMGAYLSDSGRYPEAEKYFRQALEMEEANPNTRTDDLLHTLDWLGGMIQRQGRPAEAEAVYRKCLEKAAPSAVLVVCLRSLGENYASQGKNAEAEDAFKRAAALCEGGPACTCRGMALVGLGDFYLTQGRRREAAAMADQAGKLCAGYHPPDLSMLLDLAELHMNLGDVSKGEALYSRIRAAGRSMPFNRSMPIALRRMAERDMTEGRLDEAEDLYRQIVAISKNHHDGPQEAGALDGVAASCEKEGKLQEAAGAREKAKALRGRP